MPRASIPASPRAFLLLPFVALLVISPLFIYGCSCGQDQLFHLQSWLDAASQLRHGHYPTWAITPAFHAGEPRFLFYPPLSWLLGALLVTLTSALHLPTEAAPIAFAFLALTSAGLAFHRLARAFVSPSAALLSAALYLANPYMLYNAFERSAYAELLAATWIPLLFLAILRPNLKPSPEPKPSPTIRAIAIPLALLWLTNAPAAVMGSYTLALLATLRLISALRHKQNSLALARNYLAGAALGLALPAFYLIPAAHQRKYIQVAMAIIPNMRFQDNFLFTATSDAPHNAVNRTASYLAVTLLAATLLTLATLFLRRLHAKNVVILSEGAGLHPAPQPKDPESLHPTHTIRPFLTPQLIPSPAPTLTLLTLIIAFLLLPISTLIWLHLPEFAYLQFPWRLLTILSPILCLSLALLLDNSLGAPFMRRTWRMSGLAALSAPFMRRTWHMRGLATTLVLVLPLALGILGYHLYAQPCAPTDRPSVAARLFATGHGVGPTDEYTPNDADNDLLRPDNPAFWLIPATLPPNTPAPNTIPNPTALSGDYDTPLLPSQTLSATPPGSFTIHPALPSILVLNLRAYPNWSITRTVSDQPIPVPVDLLARDDGLIAFPVFAGATTIDIHWHRSLDQNLGLAISLIALFLLALTFSQNSPTAE